MMVGFYQPLRNLQEKEELQSKNTIQSKPQSKTQYSTGDKTVPIFEFSDSDMKRGIIVDPAWYRVRIDAVSEKPAKEKPGVTPSTNVFVEGTILFNADNGSEEYAGVPTPEGWLFNSKAKGFAVGFFQSLGVDVAAGKRYEFENTVGKVLDVFIDNDEWDGRTVNKIKHKYRPAEDKQAAV
jgi:hypothetical protein